MDNQAPEQDNDVQPQVVSETTADKIDPEMMHAFGLQEGRSLMTFLEQAKCPALVIAAIDTVPLEDGGYNIFRSALGTSEAIINLIVWLQSEVMPKLAEQSKTYELQAAEAQAKG